MLQYRKQAGLRSKGQVVPLWRVGDCRLRTNCGLSEVYKKLLKQREWRLRWAEKNGDWLTLPGHQQAAVEASNGKPGKLLQFRKVG